MVVDAEEGAGKGADFAKGDEDTGIDDPYGWEEDATVEQPHSRKGEQGCCGQVDDAEVHPRVCMPRAPARAEATAMMMRITVSHTDRDLPELLVLSDVFIVSYWFKGDFSLFLCIDRLRGRVGEQSERIASGTSAIAGVVACGGVVAVGDAALIVCVGHGVEVGES